MDVSVVQLHVIHIFFFLSQMCDRYFVSPYTYITEGLLGQGTASSFIIRPGRLLSIPNLLSALAHTPITCSSTELVKLTPPSGQTCGAYLQNYINEFGGYVQDPSATSSCQFCSFASTDQFLSTSFHILYSHRWRNVGFLVAYTLVNVSSFFILMNVSFFVLTPVCYL